MSEANAGLLFQENLFLAREFEFHSDLFRMIKFRDKKLMQLLLSPKSADK